MHKGHWRGQGVPAVLMVPADGASLVGRAQAGRGPQLLPKNLLVLAGRAYVSCSCLPPPLLPPSCPGEGLALLGHPRMQPGCSFLSGLPFPGRDEGVTQGVSCHPGKVVGSSHGRPHKPPALQWAPSSPAQLRPQTHHTSGGGGVTRGEGPAPTGGDPITGQAPYPAPKLGPGQGGSGAGSRASAGVPSACSCAGSARTASAPAQSPVLGTGGRDRDSGTWGSVPELSA